MSPSARRIRAFRFFMANMFMVATPPGRTGCAMALVRAEERADAQGYEVAAMYEHGDGWAVYLYDQATPDNVLRVVGGIDTEPTTADLRVYRAELTSSLEN